MNTTARFLSIATVAAFASFGAQADESTADRAAVRAQAAEALRTGQIPSGEIGSM